MQNKPIIEGVIARSANSEGCRKAVDKQIESVKSSQPVNTSHKRVLILGGSSGFGLAARIALTFGGANADTISVSYEKAPTEEFSGSAGWHNNEYFKQVASEEGRVAVNIDGDAFSSQTREQVVEAIETYFEGEVDLIVYSIAAGRRPVGNGDFWCSSIKPLDEAVVGASIRLDNDTWEEQTIPPATPQELESTVKVMGGEDWESWIDTLINADSIAPGCKTVAFSYVGSEVTHPIYLDGTLGHAKIDLHQTSHSLNLKLSQYQGGAYACVCKALVTKASVFIPTFSPYILALYKIMKEKGTHEGCIEQMQRLFRDKLFMDTVPVDCERLIRLDEFELDSDTQNQVQQILKNMNADNFKELGDFQGYKSDFLELNGYLSEQS